jgi:vacuolar protein sorting-associated protein 52
MDEFVLLLESLADSKHAKNQKEKTVFLINNLDHMVCIFQERRVVGKECNKLMEQLLRYREVFVEEELLGSFSKMIAFVQQTEQHLKNAAATDDAIVNASVVESLVLEFASNWKTAVNQINKNVLSYFSNFRNGMEILKQCLTQLLLYYTRFQDIIRKVWKRNPPSFCKDFVPTNIILAEIKKYALAI